LGEIYSMTGFGRASAQQKDYRVTAEIRTVNNRYVDISARISRSLNEYEADAKEIIRKYLNRGRIYLTLNDLSPRIRIGEVRLDEALTSALLDHLREISQKLGLKEDVNLQHLLPFAEVIHEDGIEDIPTELFEVAEEALIASLEKLKKMRQREGAAIGLDIKNRLKKIEESVTKAEALAEGNSKKRLEKLMERLNALVDLHDLDAQRIETEAALIADKSDITEELVRLKIHCSEFKRILSEGSPCGRKLDFLMQEMNRELNTASSKADLAEMSHLVVDMKEELERMREQAQNVE